MQAEDLLRKGDLAGALESLQDEIRAKPAAVELRIFLFQLLAVMGRWDRALNQLTVAGELDSQTLPMVDTYRETLRCEALREAVFAGDRQPLLFGAPERWIALVFEALRQDAAGAHQAAADLRAEAYESVPETAGRINGDIPFAWIADGDSRIGPFVEAVVNGGYYWVPVSRLARLELDPPADLRDMVWAPVTFTWINGGKAVGFMPTRYPGKLEDTAPEFLLCRRTEWVELVPDSYAGVGQRVFVTDGDEHSLLDVRAIDFDNPELETTEAAAE